jgi:hypothetical protein
MLFKAVGRFRAIHELGLWIWAVILGIVLMVPVFLRLFTDLTWPYQLSLAAGAFCFLAALALYAAEHGTDLVEQPTRLQLHDYQQSPKSMEGLPQATNKIDFKYGGVSLATRSTEKLRAAKEVFLIVTRAVLKNPDDRPTSVRICLRLQTANKALWQEFDPDNGIVVSVEEKVKAETKSSLHHLFQRIERVDAREALDGWIVFTFDESALRQCDETALTGGEMNLEVTDVMSGHVVKWNMGGTLNRLAWKRGVLPRDV